MAQADCKSKGKRLHWRKWAKLRQVIFERDNYTCTKCGRQGMFEVHHVDHDRTNNELDNLTLLCSKCHISGHSKPTPPELVEWNEYMQNQFSTYNKSSNS